jgi:hypothetical protein
MNAIRCTNVAINIVRVHANTLKPISIGFRTEVSENSCPQIVYNDLSFETSRDWFHITTLPVQTSNERKSFSQFNLGGPSCARQYPEISLVFF